MQNPLGWITTVAWSPGSDEIAFGGYDQDIHIYNGGVTGKAVKKLEGHTDWIQSLDWSPPNGKYLASSGHDRAIYIWDLEAEKVIQTLVGGKNVVTVVQWSPAGVIWRAAATAAPCAFGMCRAVRFCLPTPGGTVGGALSLWLGLLGGG